MSSPQAQLRRRISLFQLILYGLGTTIGAGIYALIGELAAVAGYLAPMAFLMASLMAGLTALSFAELSSRFPRAAGAALYVQEGLGSRRLSTLVGLLVIVAGLVSASALVNGFVGYLGEFVPVDRVPAIVMVVLAVGALAAWGIAQSVTVAAVITLVEVGGLLLVIGASRGALAELPERWPLLIPAADSASWGAVFSGGLLAFYAYLGFEDMVDVAEEVKQVRRNMPLAIVATLLITTTLYLAVMIGAVLALPPAALAASEAPLATLFQHYTGGAGPLMGVIGLFAIINGALVQVIMAARVLYGMACRGQLPRALGAVDPRTGTPLRATALATLLMLAMALAGRLGPLARITSLVMLVVFALVNAALLRVKRRDPHPAGVVVVPRWLPAGGLAMCVVVILVEIGGLVRAP